jgi:hypothetical protein
VRNLATKNRLGSDRGVMIHVDPKDGESRRAEKVSVASRRADAKSDRREKKVVGSNADAGVAVVEDGADAVVTSAKVNEVATIKLGRTARNAGHSASLIMTVPRGVTSSRNVLNVQHDRSGKNDRSDLRDRNVQNELSDRRDRNGRRVEMIAKSVLRESGRKK